MVQTRSDTKAEPQMDAQELVECLSGGGVVDRLAVLSTLRDEPLPKTKLADRCEVSRGAVQFITEFDESLVKQSEDGYYLTGAGAIAIHKYNDASESLDDDILSALATTSNKRAFLRNLQCQPLSRSQLASQPNMPSRSTIDRIGQRFGKAGYVTRNNGGKYALTSSGENVVDTYDGVLRTFEQIIERKRGLEWLGVEIEELPAAALADARIEVARLGQGFNTVHDVLECVQSYDTDCVDHVRVISCFANSKFDEVLERFVRAGVRVDVLSPGDLMGTYLSMPEEDLVWSRRLLEPPNSSWLVHRSQLPCSLILIDDKEVVIAPRDPTDPKGAFGVIFSSDSAITAWASELFNDYASDAIQAGFWPRIVQMVKAGECVPPLNRDRASVESTSSADD